MELTTEQKEKFIQCVNVAFTLTHVADAYLTTARDITPLKHEFKMHMNKAVSSINRLSTFADNTLATGRATFFQDVHFMDNLMELVLQHVNTKEKEEQLFEFISKME